jgi:hypothetical protein
MGGLMTAEQAKEWVGKRAKKFIDEELRKVAVEDYSRYPHCAYGAAKAQVESNYTLYASGGKIGSAECAKFASKVYEFLINPKCKVDALSPSVVQVGLLPKDASCGHNVVMVNAALEANSREVSLDPLPANAANWIVVDGWRAGLGWPYDNCVFVIDKEFVDAWGARMQIIKGWNPDIPIDFRMALKKK